MKRALVLVLIIAAAAIACNKSKFETTPTVEIKSLSPEVAGVPKKAEEYSIITFRARVTDKEGDVQDTMVLVVPKYYQLDGTLIGADTIRYDINALNFPDTRDIEIQTEFTYTKLLPPLEYLNKAPEDQNFAVGIIVTDKAGNRSEYVESNKILLLHE